MRSCIASISLTPTMVLRRKSRPARNRAVRRCCRTPSIFWWLGSRQRRNQLPRSHMDWSAGEGCPSGRIVPLGQEFDQAFLEGVEVRSKFARWPRVDDSATGDHTDLAAKAANLLCVVTTEEGSDL